MIRSARSTRVKSTFMFTCNLQSVTRLFSLTRLDKGTCLFAGLCLLLANNAYSHQLECPCTVVEVIDGDTVYVQDQSVSSRKIWLAGIDAPELNQLFGNHARQNLIDLVLDQQVEVTYVERDPYGHIIGKLIKRQQDINLRQIQDGYAWHFKQHQSEQTSEDSAIYAAAERSARKNRLGLWNAQFFPPWEYRKRHPQLMVQ